MTENLLNLAKVQTYNLRSEQSPNRIKPKKSMLRYIGKLLKTQKEEKKKRNLISSQREMTLPTGGKQFK